jgi:hypothetical protein
MSIGGMVGAGCGKISEQPVRNINSNNKENIKRNRTITSPIKKDLSAL